MSRPTTISVEALMTASIHRLVEQYPGTNQNRMGRALVRLGLRQARRRRADLTKELRRLDSPWEEPR